MVTSILYLLVSMILMLVVLFQTALSLFLALTIIVVVLCHGKIHISVYRADFLKALVWHYTCSVGSQLLVLYTIVAMSKHQLLLFMF